MNRRHDDDAWIERATALLDQSAENLDAATLSRLNRARQAALVAQHAQLRRGMWGAILAATAVAAVALAIGVNRRTDMPGAPASDAAALQPADIDWLTSDDDAIDLAENFDFYAWLETQSDGPSG